MSSLDLSRLNESQRNAVTTTEGPVLIIAGPGSGKTFTLVERITYLIIEKGIKPENILIGTFTEKAAKELITRVSNRLDSIGVDVNLSEMYIGTLHSICLRIIDENLEFTRLKKNYRLLDQFEQQYLIFQHIHRFSNIENYSVLYKNNEIPSKWKQSGTLISLINKLSEELVDYEKLISYEDDLKIQVLGKVYEKYMNLLHDENVLDFSTIQLETYKLLSSNSQILEAITKKLKYLMIDEYQDTNTIQEKIIFLLMGSNKNLCVVGDDDQGLYRFRGATIRNILEFPKNFTNCTQISLDTNYRSHPDIINFYNQWMSQLPWDSYRFKKEIKPRQDEFINNPSVIKVSGQDHLEDWMRNIYDFIIKAKEQKVLEDYNQIAFLFNSVKNEKAVALSKYLEERNIPVYSPRSNLFFDREEVKLVLGTLLFAFPQIKETTLESKYVSPSLVAYYMECMKSLKEVLAKDKELRIFLQKKIKEHFEMKENLDYAFSGFFYQLLQFDTFKTLIDREVAGVKDTRELRNIGLLSNILVKFEYLHNIQVLTSKNIENSLISLFNIYLNFLIDGGINEYEDMSEYAPSGCVSFMTIHQSKGMEFPIVFSMSLENVPRKKYTDIDQILQENFYNKKPFEPLDRIKDFDFWRLYYTAFSRAQNLLVLSCVETANRQAKQRQVPSKCFSATYDPLIDWRDPSFDLSKLELEKVKTVNIKSSYSFTSHILLYEACPLQYKFFKELAFSPVRVSATIYGTLIHQTIEDIHRTVLRGEEAKITKENIESWFLSNYKSIVAKEKVYLAPQIQGSAIAQLIRYADRHSTQWDRIKETEVDVSLVKPDYILKGTIDLIRGENDTIEIVDFKSEKKPDIFSNSNKLDRYRRQLEIYAHLVEERTGQKVSKLHLYYTGAGESESPYISFPKNDSSIDNTIKVFDDIVNSIERKDFKPCKKDPKQCKECDMRFYCRS